MSLFVWIETQAAALERDSPPCPMSVRNVGTSHDIENQIAIDSALLNITHSAPSFSASLRKYASLAGLYFFVKKPGQL